MRVHAFDPLYSESQDIQDYVERPGLKKTNKDGLLLRLALELLGSNDPPASASHILRTTNQHYFRL